MAQRNIDKLFAYDYRAASIELSSKIYVSLARLQLIPGAFIMKEDYLWELMNFAVTMQSASIRGTFCAAITLNIQKAALYILWVRIIFRYQWSLPPLKKWSEWNSLEVLTPNGGKKFSQFIKTMSSWDGGKEEFSIFPNAFVELWVFFFFPLYRKKFIFSRVARKV